MYKDHAVQIESELAEFALLLKRENIKSYLEVGAKWGGTFWRIANVLPKGSRVVAVDLPDGMGGSVGSQNFLSSCIDELNAIGYDACVIFGDSHLPSVAELVRARAPFDAVFIDGDHTLAGVTQDWETYGPMAKIVSFHDIGYRREPKLIRKGRVAVPQLWESIKGQYRHIEIKASPKDCGIGVLWR